MFDAKVFKVMVGSLSGAMEDVNVAKEAIRKWNSENAERMGKVYLTLEWSTNLESAKGVDMVFGIVGNWIGDATFVEECIRIGKQVMLFFNGFFDQNNTIPSEHDKVVEISAMMKDRCVCVWYKGAEELCYQLTERLMR